MIWTQSLVDQFSKALELELKEGVTKDQAIIYTLDGAAKCAMWRVNNYGDSVFKAFVTPYTPLGYAMENHMLEKAYKVTMNADWGEAIEDFYDWVLYNQDAIASFFKPIAEPYLEETYG